jgi:hypothetical protein
MLVQFWDEAFGGFFMNVELPETPLMVRPKDTRDGAIPSGNAAAVRALSKVARRTGRMLYQDRANAILVALSSDIISNPLGYPYMLLGADEILHGEVGARQYGAQGGVKATATLTADRQDTIWLMVEIQIQPGWHINSHNVFQEQLVPTRIALDANQAAWQLGTVTYPNPEHVSLGSPEKRHALYQGTIQIRARITRTALKSSETLDVIPILLTVQGCNEQRVCLPPETLSLNVSPAALVERQAGGSRS